MKTLGFFCVVSNACYAIDLNDELSINYCSADNNLPNSPVLTITDPNLELGAYKGKLIIAYDQHHCGTQKVGKNKP